MWFSQCFFFSSCLLLLLASHFYIYSMLLFTWNNEKVYINDNNNDGKKIRMERIKKDGINLTAYKDFFFALYTQFMCPQLFFCTFSLLGKKKLPYIFFSTQYTVQLYGLCAETGTLCIILV